MSAPVAAVDAAFTTAGFGTRFRTGAATAFVSGDTIALARCSSNAIADLLWDLVADRGDVATIRERVDGDSTALALARFDGSDVRLVCRGEVTVRVTTTTAVSERSGTSTWAESTVADVREVSLIADPTPADDLAIVAGVVPAGSVTRSIDPGAPAEDRLGAAPARLATDAGFDELFGHTVARDVERAAVRTDASHVAAAPPERPSTKVLVFTSGHRVLVDGDHRVCIGRDPDVGAPTRSVKRVKLTAPALSRRHAEVATDGDVLSVRDLGSIHGTRLLIDGAAPMRLERDRPVPLSVGALVELAGVVSFRVEEVA